VTPIDLVAARRQFDRDGATPDFEYRPLEDDPAVSAKRLADVDVDSVEDPTLASLLMAKAREVGLQLDMLACRGTRDFLTMSIELYGAVSPGLMAEAEAILDRVPTPTRDDGPRLDARQIAAAAQVELDHYRALAPDIETHVEVREGSTGLMVSNGVLLIAPTSSVTSARIEALLHHEIGVHVVTHVNGANQPLHVLATGLAGHDETQEGLAVLAEHLVGGLDAARLRQLAARVVAVHQMLEGAEFPEVHRILVDTGVPRTQAFTITTRVFRSGGLTKDAVYLRGLRDLIDHLAAGHELDTLWLGKMPLESVPLVAEMHRRGALVDPLLHPRFLDDPIARDRLAAIANVSSLSSLIGDPT
jgi:uncharacterized protein (TIGR02421 family)